MSKDLLELLFDSAHTHPGEPALTDIGGITLTYQELARRIEIVATRLQQNGFGANDRMLFSIRPSLDGLILVFGAIAAGGATAMIDPGMGEELFHRRLEVVQPTWAAAESLLYAAGSPGPIRSIVKRKGMLLPKLSALPLRFIHSGFWLPGVPSSSIPLRKLGKSVDTNFDYQPLPSADAIIVLTSGTTSDPKAVVHTRESIGASFSALSETVKFSPGDSVCTDQLMIGIPALLGGAHWRMPRPQFTAAKNPHVFASYLHDSSHTFFVPADLPSVLSLIESGEVAAPPNLQQIFLGGAPVTTQLVSRTAQTLPSAETIAVYGMTEIAPVAVTPASVKLDHEGPGDPLGPLVQGVHARIAEDGELMLSGLALCRGYLGHESLEELPTGDLARLDNGFLTLLGRKKEMLIRGKTNIYPGLYEPTINAIPGVSQALFIGVPDEYGDERVVLVVVPTPEAPEDLAAQVTKKLPSLIDADSLPDEVVIRETIPLSGRSRKPDRATLREMLVARTESY